MADAEPPAEPAAQAGPPIEEPRRDENGNGAVIGSAALRPVFLGNLSYSFTSTDIIDIFERPIRPSGTDYKPIPVDRIDIKRGYCFVFLKDAQTEEDKANAERFISDINGMSVPNVSSSLRAEFARGDGRIKRKEDDRRRNIHPSETLFVVNFHEETTKREDLRMLFEPYGELVRIEMKRNYAFVQFRSVEEATRAKDEVNGGKLDQSVLTVEFVAQQRGNDRRGRRPYDRYERSYDRQYDRQYDRGDRSRDRRGPPGDFRRDRYDRYDDGRRRSPPRYRRSRSRSRSPPRHRSRSPRGRDYYDNRGGGRDYNDRGGVGGGGAGGPGGGGPGGYNGGNPSGSAGGYEGGRGRSPEAYRGRRSPERDYRPGDRGGGERGPDRGADRDRGYRP